MPRRPPVPAELEREVLIEAGHRCAIHTCRQTPLELAHIVPWSKCRDHTYDNLIALCPTCHTRFDKGEIDRKSMLEYKARLLLYSGRFTTFEFRLLKKIKGTANTEIWLLEDFAIMIDGLLEGGLLDDTGQSKPLGTDAEPARKLYRLTTVGRSFVDKFIEARP